MSNDAELSVGVEDNLTPTLAKMAAQTREFGKVIGAEAKSIDKAVRNVTKSIADLNGPNVGGAKKSPLADRAAQLNRELKEQEAIMARLARAQGAYESSSSFSGMRDASGKGIKGSDVMAYRRAEAEAERLRATLNAIPEAERRIQAAQSSRAAAATAHNQAQLAQIRALNAAGAEHAAKQAMFSQMFAKQSWWPPEMLKGPTKFANAISELPNSVRYAMYDVSRSTLIAGAAITALGVGAIVVAAQWQRAFADVERTIQGTPASLERVRQGLIGLSQDIPVGFKDLAQIASIGGQMGIAADGIVQYTETIAKLTATTNLTSDAASKALGRFKAFFAEAKDPSLAVTNDTFSNLASSILKVGVNSVATESGIVGVATQISSMGSYAGFTADQVIGLAGALSSVGVPPELSRGVITRLFNTIGEAVSENGTRLQDFAKLAGVSAEDFAAAWGTEKFAYIFTDMVHGLNDVAKGGGDAVVALHDLGISSVRDVPVLLRLATAAGEAGTAGSLLAQTMNDARTGWRENIELTLQYNKIASTLSERTKVLMQNFEALFAAMGKSATGPITNLVNGLIDIVKGFTAIMSTDVGQTFAVVATAVTLLTGGIILLASVAARSVGMMQGLSVGIQSITGSAAVAAGAVRVLSIAIASITVVTALLAVAGVIWGIAAGAEQANNAITDTSGAVAAMRKDAESAKGGLFELGGAGTEAAKGIAATSTQADILSDISSNFKDDLYGSAEAATNLGEKTMAASLVFGDASQAFVKNALLADKAFTDMFAGDQGADFGDKLVKAGFDLDTLIRKVARGGKGAGASYLEDMLGTAPNANAWDDISKSWIWMDQTAAKTSRSAGDLLNKVTGSVEGMSAAGRAAIAAGDGMIKFSDATQMTESALADFEVQNQDLIDSMAAGYAKFVDTSAMIGLTQNMQEAFATLDDGSTDIDEHAEAIAGFEKAWTDAYGGAKFSIDDYLTVFRRAAGEQELFISNLQALAARGMPTNIIGDLAEMGPQAHALVQGLINGTDAQLNEYIALYGSTGFDSMVALAAGQLAAEQIVRNAARTLSSAQLAQLSADLRAGTPLVSAMAKWNLDAQGKPLKAPVSEPIVPNMSNAQRQEWARNNSLSMGIKTYYLAATNSPAGTTSSNIKFMASGGYTGAGGMYDPAGIVHRGEYVVKKSDVDQATGTPKPAALMRLLGGRVPSRGRGGSGYADGGFVSGGSASSVVHLSVEDRMLLVAIRDSIGLTITEATLTSSVNSGNATSAYRRAS